MLCTSVCSNALRDIVQEFEFLWAFPQVAGAVNGTQIPNLRSMECPSDYIFLRDFTVLIQRVMDSKGCFIDVNIGWPGQVHNARVLANSTFYHKETSGNLLPDWKRLINGVEVLLLVFAW